MNEEKNVVENVSSFDALGIVSSPESKDTASVSASIAAGFEKLAKEMAQMNATLEKALAKEEVKVAEVSEVKEDSTPEIESIENTNQPEVEIPKVEEPVVKKESEINIDDILSQIESITPVEAAPTKEAPVVSEVTPVVAPVEEIEKMDDTQSEEPFSPVEEPVSIEETTTKDDKDDKIISMDQLLASEEPLTSSIENKVETPAVENVAPVVAPVEQAVVTPAEATPVAPAIENAAPVVAPVEQEVVTPAEATPVAPVIENAAPVVAPVEQAVVTPIEATPVTPVIENVAPVAQETATVSKISDVTKFYPSSFESKTGNDPHRVMTVDDNNVFIKDDNALVMKPAA